MPRNWPRSFQVSGILSYLESDLFKECLNILEIRRHLVEDIEQFADEYNKFIDDTPNHLLFQSIPKPFIIGNIPSFVDKLSVTRIIDSDEFIYTLICLKARALWNAEKFSKSLPTLAVACQFWLANVESR